MSDEAAKRMQTRADMMTNRWARRSMKPDYPTAILIASSVLLHPGLLIVDHIHFQVSPGFDVPETRAHVLSLPSTTGSYLVSSSGASSQRAR